MSCDLHEWRTSVIDGLGHRMAPLYTPIILQPCAALQVMCASTGSSVKLVSSKKVAHGFAAKVTDYGFFRSRCLTTYAQMRPDGATLRSMAPEALLIGACSKVLPLFQCALLEM